MTEHSNPKPRPSRDTLGLLALGLLACAALATLVLARQPPSQLGSEPTPPAIEGAANTCSRPSDARRRARQASDLATAKLERYPLVLAEGIAGFDLYDEALHCLHITDDPELNAQIHTKRTDLLERLERDYRTLLLRLERARAAERPASTSRAARELAAFLEARPGPYHRRLKDFEQEFEAREETP
ncbi:MAG: hypothetical protein OEZ06_02450 [Myxococcales bacterium]|nr:hypothetical protein [Myxococcales bacterium]